MPELPEVETVVRGLVPVLTGRRFVRVVANRPDLRRPLPADLGQRLTRARVDRVARRAKYGLIDTDRGDTLLFHLGMTGRFRVDPAEPSIHDHVEFDLDDGRRVVLTDPRRFGLLDLTPTADLPRHPLLRGIGVEPLSPAFTGARLHRLFAGRVAAAKVLLMDQRLVAGVGNIYAAEALFRARLHPERAAGALTRPECDRLARALKAVLREAIAAGGSSSRDHVRPDGELGAFQHAWRVYGRAGEPCRTCRGRVSKLTQGGRTTFLCTDCQR